MGNYFVDVKDKKTGYHYENVLCTSDIVLAIKEAAMRIETYKMNYPDGGMVWKVRIMDVDNKKIMYVDNKM